jgi:hypothetical protein
MFDSYRQGTVQQTSAMNIDLSKQEISFACVHALAAQMGYSCIDPRVDDGTDLIIRATWDSEQDESDGSPLHSHLDFQMKTTASRNLVQRITKTDFEYRLPRENYDKLRRPSDQPQYLVVVLVPPLLYDLREKRTGEAAPTLPTQEGFDDGENDVRNDWVLSDPSGLHIRGAAYFTSVVTTTTSESVEGNLVPVNVP